MIALWVQAVVAVDTGVVASAVRSVIHVDLGRVGVPVVRSGPAYTADCDLCKSEVIVHMVFSHHQVLGEMLHVHNIAHLRLGFSSGVLVHPRRTELAVGASNGVMVQFCRTERAVGCPLALRTLLRHTIRAHFQNGGVGDSASLNMLASQ